MAGGPVAAGVFRGVDPRLGIVLFRREGERFRRGDRLLRVRGRARSILAAERTALNFLQHLCGVAAATARVVRAVHGTGVAVLATRKTLPGLRALQKEAVRQGGGLPHREGLFDEVLLKENHLQMAGLHPLLLVKKVRAAVGPRVPVTAEARSLREARLLVLGGADRILLDNLSPARLRRMVPRLRSLARRIGRPLEIEASGGIHVGNARAFAKAGVDRISLGSLTHSVRAVDLSLDIRPLR